jgi:hypothetical protein
MDDYEDEFIRIRNRPDHHSPEIWHRRFERIQVGTWLFGLLPVYRYSYTEWEKQK